MVMNRAKLFGEQLRRMVWFPTHRGTKQALQLLSAATATCYGGVQRIDGRKDGTALRIRF